jgi:maltose O-acetyltransferase
MKCILDTLRNPVANFALEVLPSAGCFEFKRTLLNALGFELGIGCEVTGGVKFYGRGRIAVGEDTRIGPCTLFIVAPDAAVVVGARCDIGPRVMFRADSRQVRDQCRRAGVGYPLPITVGDGSWVGTGAVLLGGASVGSASILAAGALLLPGDYPADTLLAGCPATPQRTLT